MDCLIPVGGWDTHLVLRWGQSTAALCSMHQPVQPGLDGRRCLFHPLGGESGERGGREGGGREGGREGEGGGREGGREGEGGGRVGGREEGTIHVTCTCGYAELLRNSQKQQKPCSKVYNT